MKISRITGLSLLALAVQVSMSSSSTASTCNDGFQGPSVKGNSEAGFANKIETQFQSLFEAAKTDVRSQWAVAALKQELKNSEPESSGFLYSLMAEITHIVTGKIISTNALGRTVETTIIGDHNPVYPSIFQLPLLAEARIAKLLKSVRSVRDRELTSIVISSLLTGFVLQDSQFTLFPGTSEIQASDHLTSTLLEVHVRTMLMGSESALWERLKKFEQFVQFGRTLNPQQFAVLKDAIHYFGVLEFGVNSDQTQSVLNVIRAVNTKEKLKFYWSVRQRMMPNFEEHVPGTGLNDRVSWPDDLASIFQSLLSSSNQEYLDIQTNLIRNKLDSHKNTQASGRLEVRPHLPQSLTPVRLSPVRSQLVKPE